MVAVVIEHHMETALAAACNRQRVAVTGYSAVSIALR